MGRQPRLDGLHRGALEVRSDRENWKAIRQDVLVHGLSQRAACEKYQLGWHTLKKILAHAELPGYRQRQARPRRVLAPVLPIIAPVWCRCNRLDPECWGEPERPGGKIHPEHQARMSREVHSFWSAASGSYRRRVGGILQHPTRASGSRAPAPRARGAGRGDQTGP